MTETGKPVILVVDDEPEMLHSLRGLLRMEFEVHTASNGPEALHILAREPIEVLLSDQRMPAMTGTALLGQARHRRPSAIRVMFTAYADVKTCIDVINTGQVFRLLTKPWEPGELLAVMHEASAEYHRRADQLQLFVELQNYQMQCLALVEGLQSGEFGTLTEAGEDAVTEVTTVGYALLERFDRTLGLATEEGSGG